jgi:hypothetical protein
MNRNISISAYVLAAIACASCSSAKKAAEAAETDSYGAPEAAVKIASAAAANTDTVVSGGRTLNLPKQDNWFARFVTGGQKDIEMDSSKIFQLTMVGSLRQEDAEAIYNIESGYSGFSAMYQSAWTHLLFADVTRKAFSSSVQQYLADFEAKKLDREDTSSYKTYGEYPVKIQWGTIPGMMSGYADTNVQFGYEFKNRSPYFSVTVWKTANAMEQDGTSEVPESNTIHFYMTKSQASQMADLLSDEKIADALAPYMQKTAEDKTPAADTY